MIATTGSGESGTTSALSAGAGSGLIAGSLRSGTSTTAPLACGGGRTSSAISGTSTEEIRSLAAEAPSAAVGAAMVTGPPPYGGSTLSNSACAVATWELVSFRGVPPPWTPGGVAVGVSILATKVGSGATGSSSGVGEASTNVTVPVGSGADTAPDLGSSRPGGENSFGPGDG